MSRERVSIVDVKSGLYVLRYEAGAGASDLSPSIAVSLLDKSSDIELVADPHGEAEILRGPGECLVLRAKRPGRVRIVSQAKVGGTTDAVVKLERLGLSPIAQTDSAPPIETKSGSEFASIRVLGHLSRRGDVLVEEGEWVGGPDLPLPIEGIEIRRKSDGPAPPLDIQILSGEREAQWSEWTPMGAFAGSRGRSQSLRGVRVRLREPQTSLSRIKARAVFLGRPVETKIGTMIELAGPGGRDPLVGLSLQVLRDGSKDSVAPLPPTGQATLSRVRIFRPGERP